MINIINKSKIYKIILKSYYMMLNNNKYYIKSIIIKLINILKSYNKIYKKSLLIQKSKELINLIRILLD